jgi:hypothetical protein
VPSGVIFKVQSPIGALAETTQFVLITPSAEAVADIVSRVVPPPVTFPPYDMRVNQEC